MEKFVYQYDRRAILLDKLIVYANWEHPFTLDSTPRCPDIDYCQFQKVSSICTTSLNLEVLLDQYQNSSGEVIYKAEKGPNGIFRLGKLSPYLSSCVAICFVEASEQSEISLRLMCNLPCKLFLNGSFVAMGTNLLDQSVKCKLAKGQNTLVFECYSVSPDSEICIRMSDLRTEEANGLTALESENCSDYNHFLTVLYEGDGKDGKISYFAYLDDQVHQYGALRFVGEILDADGKCIGTFEPHLLQRTTIQLTDYPLQELDIPSVTVRFSVWEGGKLLYEACRIVTTGDLKETNDKIIAEATRMQKDMSILAYDRYAIKQCLKMAQEVGTDPDVLWTQTSYIRSILFRLRSGLHMNDIYRFPKGHNIHFRNPLDGQNDMYIVVTPDGYMHSKKYPLMINICNANRQNHFEFYESILDQGVIFADFFLKGITLGSYIGEAEFFILLNDIKKRFHIDEDRIYLSGGCNGAYAALALAQNYPHLFAGVFSIAGEVYLPALKNLLNIPVYNVFSYTDILYTRSKRKQLEAFSQLPMVQNVPMEACTHTMLMKSIQRRRVIEELLGHERNQYPDHIQYYTERNCHNKCYWLELLGIEFGQSFSEIEGYADVSSITVTCKNSIGVKIQIPPCVDKRDFRVHINGITYRYTKYRKNHLTFVLSGDRYLPAEEAPQVHQLKGLGILGVYRGPLDIVCDKSNPTHVQVATVLSHPCTMGFRPNIMIDYPVRDNRLSHRVSRNQILIRRYDQETEYDSLLSVKFEKKGFLYQNILYEGAFLILEAVEVPETHSVVLSIAYHDESLLPRLLFLRKMILPGYCNGSRGLLNNQILIFDGRRCCVVYEPGAPLIDVGSK